MHAEMSSISAPSSLATGHLKNGKASTGCISRREYVTHQIPLRFRQNWFQNNRITTELWWWFT